MSDVQHLAGAIRFHRKRAGLSQQALARLAGVGKTAVFDLEKGKETVQLDTMVKVLLALNISIRFDGPLMREFNREVTE